MFASGVHWIFVPIDQFSSTPTVLGVLIVFGFVALVAGVYFILPFLILGRFCAPHPLGLLLGLPAMWVVTEWLRTWLFTGFPWLFLGYGHLHTWLSGWAPITGVLGIGFILCFTASSLIYAWKQRRNIVHAVSPLVATLLLWGIGFFAQSLQWTQPFGETVKVGIAQGNISPDKKWQPSYLQPTLDRYKTLSDELWDNDWVIWPEAAIPLIANSQQDYARLQPLLEELKYKAIANNAALITGILVLSPERKIHNSIMATGLGSGLYFKQRLVPVGEYAPLEDYLSGVFNFFKIPRSMIAPGPSHQAGLQIGATLLAPTICYEIVYPDLVAETARSANVLITISNDAWFGHSIGPNQHMQMAQMRALETRRYLIRGTNNGISALVDDRGNILVKSKSYVMDAIEGEIDLRQGLTPFMQFGSWPIVAMSLVILLMLGILARRNKEVT